MKFLADFEKHWRTHGRKVLHRLAEKYPQAYFGGAVALAKTIKWETREDDAADGFMTPEQIMSAADRRPDYHKRQARKRVARMKLGAEAR